LVPGPTSAVVMTHRLDNGVVEVISRRCSSSPPGPGETLPCISVGTDEPASLLVIDVWAFQNGGWQPGL
jgi:hypothetical protein